MARGEGLQSTGMQITRKVIETSLDIQSEVDSGTKAGTLHNASLASIIAKNQNFDSIKFATKRIHDNSTKNSRIFSTHEQQQMVDQAKTVRFTDTEATPYPAPMRSQLQIKPKQFTSLPKLVPETTKFKRKANSIMQMYEDKDKSTINFDDFARNGPPLPLTVKHRKRGGSNLRAASPVLTVGQSDSTLAKPKLTNINAVPEILIEPIRVTDEVPLQG